MQTMNKIVMTLAGLLLIAATVLKCHEMIDTCIPSWDVKAQAVILEAQKAGEDIPVWKANALGFWESYEFSLFQIPLEFALGVWLVCGLFRKAAWIAGTVCYLGFIGVTLTKALTGAADCGCWGLIKVDPWITLFAVDVPIFLLLLLFRPKGYKLLPPPWPNLFYLLLVFVPTIGIMALAPSMLVTFQPDCIKAEDKQPDESAQLRLQIHKLKQDLSTTQQQIDALKQTITELQQSPPKPDENENIQQSTEIESPVVDTNDAAPVVEQWDWLDYVVEDDVRQQISEGLVVVMMHRFDCEVCEEMAPRYSEYYQQLVDQGAADFKIAFLSIPPYGDEDHVPRETLCIVGNLTDEQNWELMSPYVVALLDGELIKTWEQGTAPEPENILDEVFGE
jgi:hypothetical protein